MSSGGNKNYNEIDNFTIFRKPSLWLHFEGTIIDARYLLAPTFMYFCKINEDACREAITGRMFYRGDDNIFYNEECGLYFNVDNISQVTLDGFNKMCDDSKYISEVNNFFDYYKKVKNTDNEKRDKAEYLMLKKGIKFRE
jgi:hypothetical protein